MNKLHGEMTEEELLAEHEADKVRKEAIKKAEEEEEHEKRRIEYRAREEKEQSIRNERNSKFLDRIRVWVIKNGEHTCIIDKEHAQIVVDGVDATWIISVQEEYSQISSWRSKPTGKYKIVIGDFGNRTTYRQRKDGTHHYENIAENLIHYADKKNTEEKLNAIQKSNRTGVEALRKFLGADEYSGPFVVNPSAVPDRPVFVKVKIEKAMTYHEAETLHAALKSLGHVK